MRSSGPRTTEHCRRRYVVTRQQTQLRTYNGADSGAQPLINEEGTVSLAVNGEIYNHRILRKGLKNPYNFKTHSDCEVIIPLVRMGQHCRM